MKKSFLFLSCSLVLMFMVGCKKGPVLPSISILRNQGCVLENSQVYYGGEITVGFHCTGENLTNINVVLSQNDSILACHSDSLNAKRTDPVTSIDYKHPFTLEVLGPVTVTGTLTDSLGQVATISFDINYNETPSMKFVGHYEGKLYICGAYNAELSVIGTQDGDLDSVPFTTIADIFPGEIINEVVANLTLGDSLNVVRGTVDGDNVFFDEINSTFVFDYSYDGFFTINIPIVMDAIYTMHGTLIEGVLYLEGECRGEGDISTLGGVINGPMTMSGTLNGSLTKYWKR
jgi:hypothetical protein